MIVILHAILLATLLLPFWIGAGLGLDFLEKDFLVTIGLCLQLIVGFFVSVYTQGYEEDRKKTVLIGYSIFFFSTGLCYVIGKSIWLVVFWELSTVSAFLLYPGGKWKQDALRSIVSLTIASGIGAYCIFLWVISKDPAIGLVFLLLGALVKSGVFGFHFWLPEAHSGAPAHVSAVYSGLLVNLPLVLFFQFGFFEPQIVGYAKYLIPVCGIGVLWAGIVAFFSMEIKRSIAYSTVENMNFLWLCLFLSAFWRGSQSSNLRLLSDAFLTLFCISLIHHSVSKSFQFLGFGYLAKVSGSPRIDDSTGIAKFTAFSSLSLAIGTMSFSALPGTAGFLSEAIFLKLISGILETPGQSAILILPLLLLVCTGLAFGSAAHLRLFYTLVVSRPRAPFIRKEKNAWLNFSIQSLGFCILLAPVLIQFYLTCFVSDYLGFGRNWILALNILTFLGITILLLIGYLRFYAPIRTRQTWDCGNADYQADSAITATGFSEPLLVPVGRYLMHSNGIPKLDYLVIHALSRILEIGKRKISGADDESISLNLKFSSITVVFILILILGLRFMEGGVWRQTLRLFNF